MFEVSMEDLKNVLMDFYNLTKFKIVLYDSDRNFLYSYPETMCRFCKTVRTNPALAKKCISCDNIGFDICDETRKPFIYKCHMSITEAIAPIYSNEINVGYLMFGQILETDHQKVREAAKKISAAYNLSLTDSMISEMTTADEAYINSAVNMMTMCANYLYTNEIIRSNPNILIYQLKEYISSHLADISIELICKHFYISQTKLYKISKKHFNMGISDYIRQQRIKKAKKLLGTTDTSVSQIASAVGINDTNYFIRIFKKSEGYTPLQYRKKYLEQQKTAAKCGCQTVEKPRSTTSRLRIIKNIKIELDGISIKINCETTRKTSNFPCRYSFFAKLFSTVHQYADENNFTKYT